MVYKPCVPQQPGVCVQQRNACYTQKPLDDKHAMLMDAMVSTNLDNTSSAMAKPKAHKQGDKQNEPMARRKHLPLYG